jgi:hypothetical protein
VSATRTSAARIPAKITNRPHFPTRERDLGTPNMWMEGSGSLKISVGISWTALRGIESTIPPSQVAVRVRTVKVTLRGGLWRAVARGGCEGERHGEASLNCNGIRVRSQHFPKSNTYKPQPSINLPFQRPAPSLKPPKCVFIRIFLTPEICYRGLFLYDDALKTIGRDSFSGGVFAPHPTLARQFQGGTLAPRHQASPLKSAVGEQKSNGNSPEFKRALISLKT